ncbi:MAG: flavodoxin [Oscillospiraceae bacterium]|nr:flavodoxin [Oscillospiraceae bacterium]
MKKLTALILAAVLVLSLAACGTANNAATDTRSTNAPASAAPDASAAPSGKVLVVYYSASGNTERVAKDIAGAAGADLFEITPTEVYTDDDLNWRNSDSRVSREHDDEFLRDVPLTTTEVPDWDSYDTVFIGYPIWWGIAAWPVDNFVKANDFTGKTVIPFATSTSSGMGQSGNLLRDLAGTGDWQDGQRFRSNASADDAADWVSSLGLG